MYDSFDKFLSSSPDFSIIDKGEDSIVFEYKELHYFFVYDPNDPYYIRLMLPNIISKEDFEKKQNININDVINNYNTDFKAIKLIIVDNSLWLSIEQFVYSKDNIRQLFTRLISILETVISHFRENHLQTK